MHEVKLFFPLCCTWTLQTGLLSPVSDTFEVHEAKLFFPLCCKRGPYKLVYCRLFQTPLRCTRRSCSSHFAVSVDLTNWSTVACFRHLWGAGGEAVLPTLLYAWTLQTGPLSPVSDTFEVHEAKLFFPFCCTRGPYKLVYCRLFQTPLRCTRRSCSSPFAVRVDLTNWSTVACFRHLWGARGEAVLPTLLYAWTLHTGLLSPVSDTFEVQEAKLFFPLCCMCGPYKLVYCRLFQTPLRCTRRSCSSHFAVRVDLTNWSTVACFRHLWGARGEAVLPTLLYVDLTNWSTVACFRHLWGARGEAVLPTLLYAWTLQTGLLSPVSDTFEVHEAKLFFPLCCTRGPYKLVYCRLFQTPLRCTRRSCSSTRTTRTYTTSSTMSSPASRPTSDREVSRRTAAQYCAIK